VGRQDHERDVLRHGEVAAHVPARAVEHQGEVGVGRPGRGAIVEEDLHRRGVDGGQDEGDVLSGGRPDRGEDVGSPIAELLHARRALVAPPPAVADPALVATRASSSNQSSMRLPGWRAAASAIRSASPPFLKASCASASRFGWYGRAFWAREVQSPQHPRHA
jgi:hypothetical protein